MNEEDIIKNDGDDTQKLDSDIVANIARIFEEELALHRKISKQNAIRELKTLCADIKDLNKGIRWGRVKIISYLLTLSILISVPVSSFLGIRKKTEYKTVYPTKEVIYDTEANYEYESGYYHGEQLVGNLLKYDLEYLEIQPNCEGTCIVDENYHNCYYRIVEKTQWEIIGREAVREVRTCIIPLSEIGNVVNINDFNTLFVTYNGEVQKEVILKSDVPRSDRKFYAEEENQGKKTYEVIRYDQDLNSPYLLEVAKDYHEVYAILLAELFIWALIVGGTKSSLIEGVINTTQKLIKDKRIAKEEREKLAGLYDKYVKTYEQNEQKEVKSRKK